MSKIIFLDIDGVLNSNFWNDAHQKEISDGTLIDAEKVKLLGELVRSTDASIILHSGWRFWFDSNLEPTRKEAANLRILLAGEGISIAGVTPDFTTEEIRKTRKFSLVKAREIFAWLSEHQEATKWIVIDDLDLHDDEIAKHQIKTDPQVGLTIENIQRAKEILL